MPKPNPSANKALTVLRDVQYIDSRGRMHNATVVGGSGATLNLHIHHLPASIRRASYTGIAKRTAKGQTNRWF
jgi:cellobiose-specific phosphotransferase system component IIC